MLQFLFEMFPKGLCAEGLAHNLTLLRGGRLFMAQRKEVRLLGGHCNPIHSLLLSFLPGYHEASCILGHMALPWALCCYKPAASVARSHGQAVNPYKPYLLKKLFTSDIYLIDRKLTIIIPKFLIQVFNL